MSDLLKNYIEHCVVAITYHDSAALRNCFTINPGPEEGQLRASLRVPNEFDLYAVPDPFKPVIKSHIELMKAVYCSKSTQQAFHSINAMVSHLVRACESQSNWVNAALVNCVRELNAVYRVMEKTGHASPHAQEPVPAWEQLVNTISKAFKIVLNDKNLNPKLSKRQDVYFFIANMMKLYFKVDKVDMARLVEKALGGARIEMPPMAQHKADACAYLYYSGLLLLGAGEYTASVEKLEQALGYLSFYRNGAKAAQKVWAVLIPLKLYTSHQVIRKRQFWALFPSLDVVYRQQLVKAVSQGCLYAFEKVLEKMQTYMLGRNMYLVMEMLRQRCQLNLIRRTSRIVASMAGGNHIVPLSAYQVALHVSCENPRKKSSAQGERVYQYTLDHIECMLANLIAENHIKGYLSHANRCIVLSKTNAFPRG